MHSFETHIKAQSCKASYVVFNRPSVQVVIEMRAQVLHKIGTIRCAGQTVLDTVCQTPFAKQNVEHKIIIKKCSTKCALENVQQIMCSKYAQKKKYTKKYAVQYMQHKICITKFVAQL